MGDRPRPASLVAERAVRYLRATSEAVTSRRLAREVLATRVGSEDDARRLLQAAFDGDTRLGVGEAGWTLREAAATAPAEQDRALVFLEGSREGKGQPFRLHRVSALRLRGEDVLVACGGDVVPGAAGADLCRAVTQAVSGALVVVHDPPGSLHALENWTGEVLRSPLSLRRLARARLGLPARHELAQLAARLRLPWRDSDDPLDYAETVEACLDALRRPGETLSGIAHGATRGVAPIDWSRFEFDRGFLDAIPREAGVYRFFDDSDGLLYVGKSKDLRRRIHSYFREGSARTPRTQALLERLHRIEYERSGSELEAMLREAAQIQRDAPAHNVQRRLSAKGDRSLRVGSILILEPAEAPATLRAYLIRGGRLLARVSIGPRGGGLRKINRILDDHFFSCPDGPTPAAGSDLDVELVVRWLRDNRDRVIALDPTTLQSAAEVIDRLRWYLTNGSLTDTDGSPILPR